MVPNERCIGGRGRGRGACLALLALAAVLACCAGCRSSSESTAVLAEEGIDVLALRYDLDRFADRAIAEVVGLASTVAAETDDRAVRELTLRWKIMVVDMMAKVTDYPDPRQAFLMTWILLARDERAVTLNTPLGSFVGQEKMVGDLIAKLEEDLVSVGHRHFTEEQMAEAEVQVESFAEASLARNPKGFSLSGIGSVGAGVLRAPLAPFKGVANTPAAIADVASAAEDFTDMLGRLPQRLRWEIELLLLGVDDMKVITDFRRDLNQLTVSFEGVAKMVESLPDEVRAELSTVLQTVEDAQPQLQATVREAKATVQEVGVVVDKAGDLAKSLAAMVGQVEEAAAALEKTAEAAKDVVVMTTKPGEPKPPRDPDAKRFDITEYTEVAVQTGDAISQARGLLGDLDKSLAADGGVEQVIGRVESLINLALWRGIMLIAAALVAAIAYRWISVRIARAGQGKA